MITYIINLKQRTDRKEQVLQELAKLDFLEYSFIEAIEHTNPQTGCTLSHKLCVQMAKELKLPYVLLLEDDVTFTENAASIFNSAWNEVQRYDWDILYLGGNVRGKGEYLSSNLAKVTKVNTTHAYIVNEKLYDTILALPDEPVIDLQYRSLSDCQTYICAPIIAFQRKSYSDLVKKDVDYTQNMLFNFKINVKK